MFRKNKPNYLIFFVILINILPLKSYSDENLIKIGTGGPRGVYFQVGNNICKMVAKIQSKEHGRKGTDNTYFCSAPSTGGSNFNIGKINIRELDFGVSQSDWQYHAYNGTSKWSKYGPVKNLRSVFSLHNEPFQIWVRKKAKIKSFRDLKNKVVNIGNPGSGQRGFMEMVMKAYDVDKSFFKRTTELSSSEQIKALCDGKIDAFGYAVGFPNGAMENAASCGAKAYPISFDSSVIKELLNSYTAFAPAVIPRGTYTGQKKDAYTFGVKATLVTHRDVSNETVYDVVKAVYENLDDFKMQHPAFKYLNREMMLEGLSAPLHAGAIRYYKEIGYSFPSHLYIADKPQAKNPKIKVVKKPEITIDKNSDNEAPVLEITENITVTKSNYIIKGKVFDKSKKYIQVDGQYIEINNNEFIINRFSPVDEIIKIVATDQWGNKNIKTINIKVNIKQIEALKIYERLKPDVIKVAKSNNKIGIIIGIEKYETLKNLDALYANRDAKFFYEYAKKAFGIQEENIKLLVDKAANRREILKALKLWLPTVADKNKDIYLFFAGHGLASDDGKDLYIIPQDGDSRLLEDTAISRLEIIKLIKKTNPKSVTMFFDTCYSGQTRDEKTLVAGLRPLRIVANEQDTPDNFTIFTASGYDQTSGSIEGAKHGMFSYHLMKGLEGKADKNEDKKITNGELIAYLKTNVNKEAFIQNREQNPMMSGKQNQVLVNFK